MRFFLFGVLVFLLVRPSHEVLAQNFYIKFSTSDCINCSAVLRQLPGILGDQKIQFLLQEKDISDSAQLKKLLGLQQCNYELHFSDSLYHAFKKGLVSYLIVQNGNQLYLDPLKSLNLEKLKEIIEQKEPLHVQDICKQVRNTDSETKPINSKYLVGSHTGLGRQTIHNYAEGGFVEFFVDSIWEKMAYQAYFGHDHFQVPFDFLLQMKGVNPSLNNQSNFIGEVDGYLYYMCSIVFLDTQTVATEVQVNVFSRKFVFKYNYEEKRPESCYPISTDFSDYFLKKDAILLSPTELVVILSADVQTDSSRVAARFVKEGNHFLFDGFLPFSTPSNYLEYQLENNFKGIITHDRLFCFQLSNVIYDIEKNLTYSIPLKKEVFNSLEGLLDHAMKVMNGEEELRANHFIIYDITQKGNHIGVLYRNHFGEVRELIFDKNSKLINDQKLGSHDNRKYDHAMYHPSDNNRILYQNKSNSTLCYDYLDIEYSR